MTPKAYKAARTAIGTQTAVATLLGVSRVTVAKRETGKMVITKEAALAIKALVPTELMEKVRRHLQSHPGASKTELRALGKPEYVEMAVDALVRADQISMKPGKRGRHSYYMKEAK